MIPEPPNTYGLWGAVKAAAPPAWPDTNEDQMLSLAATWKSSSLPFTGMAETNTDGLRPAWEDDAGYAYADRLDMLKSRAAITANAMDGMSAKTYRFHTVVETVKNGITELIEINLPRYEPTLELPDGVREVVQNLFVTRIADGVRELMNTDVAAWLNPDTNPDGLAGLEAYAAGVPQRTVDAINGDLAGKWQLLAGEGTFLLSEAGASTMSEVLKHQGAGALRSAATIDAILDSPFGATLSEADRSALQARSAALNAGALDDAVTAGRFSTIAGRVAGVAKVAGPTAGVIWDIVEGKKDAFHIAVGTAASSGAAWAVGKGVGLGTAWLASAATGAAAGSVIPIVGTVVGGVVGAIAGLAASGVVDGLLDDKSLTEALHDGGQAIVDAGEVLADGAGWLGDRALDGGLIAYDWFNSLF